MAMTIQDFIELNEAFNSEPYEVEYSTYGASSERYFFEEDANHKYKLEINKPSKSIPLGKDVRTLWISYKSSGVNYKPVIGKFKDPKRVIATVLSVLNKYKDDGKFATKTKGFAIRLNGANFGAYAGMVQKIAKMYLRQQFNVYGDPVYDEENDATVILISRKSAHFETVFKDFVEWHSSVAGDAGVTTANTDIGTPPVEVPAAQPDTSVGNKLKFDVGDFIYSAKLKSDKYYDISGITYSYNEPYYEVSQIPVGKDASQIELNTRIKAKFADSNFELYDPSQFKKDIFHKFKVGQSIAKNNADYYLYIINVALGDDPIYYYNVYDKATNSLKYADRIAPVEIIDALDQGYSLYSPDTFVKPGTWLKFGYELDEVGKGDDMYMLILSYSDGDYTANIYDKYGYTTKSNYDPSATEVSALEVLPEKPEFEVEPFNSDGPKWSKGDNVATPLSSVFVAISAIKNGQYEATLLNKSDTSIHTPIALYPFITFDDPSFEPYVWKPEAETKFKAGQYIARPYAPSYAQVMEVYTADDGKVYYIVDKYGKEDNLPKESPGIHYEVDVIDKADPPFTLYTPIQQAVPEHAKGYNVGDEVYISKSATGANASGGAGKSGKITAIVDGDIMVSTTDGSAYLFDQENIQWLKKNTKVTPSKAADTTSGFDVKPAGAGLPKVSRTSNVMKLKKTKELVAEIQRVTELVSDSKEALGGMIKVSYTHSDFMGLLLKAKKLEDLIGTEDFQSLAKGVYAAFERTRNESSAITPYKFMERLTSEMRNNIGYYTGTGYGPMNKKLRKGESSKEIESIDAAFTEAGLNLKGITVYRGQKTDTQALKSLEAGNLLCFPTYTSTSLRLEIAFAFANTQGTKEALTSTQDGSLKLAASGRAKAVFQIENIDRVLSIPVLGSSQHSTEAEIILHRNTYVKLTSPNSYVDFQGGRFYQVTVVEESMLTEQEKKASIIMSFEEFLNESEKSEMKQDFDDAVTKIQVLAAASRPATDVAPRENWTDDAFVMVNSDKQFKVYDDLNYLVGAFDTESEAQEFASQRANYRVVNASL